MSFRKLIVFQKAFELAIISKLSDSDAENTETQVWLDFAIACNYLEKEHYKDFISKSEEIGKLLQYMMTSPEKFS